MIEAADMIQIPAVNELSMDISSNHQITDAPGICSGGVMTGKSILLILFFLIPALTVSQPVTSDVSIPFAPRTYVCYHVDSPLKVDGVLDEAAWQAAPWTEYFVDIEGDRQPKPRFATRAKMLWDEEYFYVSAELEEPDIWGTLTERDTVIFYDNDFEIFIDPDGDTHAYYEFEMNALGTVWDLMLLRPYRDGGPPVNGWDIAGLQVGVNIEGTINHPGDHDRGWTLEVAMPWRILKEAAPESREPAPGEQWRVNFSRVQWQVDVVNGRYVKRIDSQTGKPLPEDNWVWSLQGAINMHMPERWGFVQFSGKTAGKGTDEFVENPNERVRWALRQIYYLQRSYYEQNGRYASRLEDLEAGELRVEGIDFRPSIEVTSNMYEISAPGFSGKTIHIRQDGLTWED